MANVVITAIDYWINNAGRFAMSLVRKRHVIEEAMARLDQPDQFDASGKDCT